MPTYPSPNENPSCECRLNPMRSFFCPSGHMTECHYPYTCEQAGCSHLTRYDLEPEEVDLLQLHAVGRLKDGLMRPYTLRENGEVLVVKENCTDV